MLYHFELQMAGVILLTAMVVCGVSLWLRRKSARKEFKEPAESGEAQDQGVK